MTIATIDRRDVLSQFFPNPQDYLFISGLAGSARDTAALTNDGSNIFAMAGAMGAAVSMGLGVAMSAPNRKVAVIAGDGELLMNVGSLATVATIGPENLSIICIDNGCHGETGGQTGHTSNKTDLEMMARGAGIASTVKITNESELSGGAAFLNDVSGPRFIHVWVKDGPPATYKRNLNPAECRLRFRNAVL